jgi:phosphate transport system permease protein
MGHFSGLAGAVALAVIVIPVVVRTTEDMLILVPNQLREAAAALGTPRALVIAKVCYRAASAGMVTGVLLATARISGETAPLLFTALFSDYWISRSAPEFLPKAFGDLMQPTASLAVLIYNFSGSPFDNQIDLAWAAALVLVVIVLLVNLAGHSLARRSGGH